MSVQARHKDTLPGQPPKNAKLTKKADGRTKGMPFSELKFGKDGHVNGMAKATAILIHAEHYDSLRNYLASGNGQAELAHGMRAEWPDQHRPECQFGNDLLWASLNVQLNVSGLLLSLELHSHKAKVAAAEIGIENYDQNTVHMKISVGLEDAVSQSLELALTNSQNQPMSFEQALFKLCIGVYLHTLTHLDGILVSMAKRQADHAPVPPDEMMQNNMLPTAYLSDSEDEFEPSIAELAARMHTPQDDEALGVAPIYEVDPDLETQIDLYKIADIDIGDLQNNANEADKQRYAIKQRGANAAVRHLKHASADMIAALQALKSAAPHMSELTQLLIEQAQLSIMTKTPMACPPVVLLSKAGFGKSWWMNAAARALGLPHRQINMNATTLDQTFAGSHPSWRDSSPGQIWRTLIKEPYANALMLVDEIDKVSSGEHNQDPYRPFYTLLEPENATHFIDEFMSIPIDASHILWIMTANDISHLPDPILSRLTIINVPDITPENMLTIVESIYRDLNAYYKDSFEPRLRPQVLAKLVQMTPRMAKRHMKYGVAKAVASGRHYLVPDDLAMPEAKVKNGLGFTAGI